MEPTNYGLIASYGLQMTIVFMAGLGVWTMKVMASQTATIDWYRANGLRLVIAFVNFWVIAAGLVVVPNFAAILGSWGVDADKGTAIIAAFILVLAIKTEAKSQPLEVSVVPAADPKAADQGDPFEDE